ncbi:hypothetical protein ABKV19_017073 [Rosa sericea]
MFFFPGISTMAIFPPKLTFFTCFPSKQNLDPHYLQKMRTTVTATISPTKLPSTEGPSDMAPPVSPWHSPFPYLLGGLVTMAILVVCALLILACSFWKRHEEGSNADRDLESGGDSVKVFKDKVLVIMAGNENSTYLATPIPDCPTKSSSFEEESEKIEGDDKEENCEKLTEAASSTPVS